MQMVNDLQHSAEIESIGNSKNEGVLSNKNNNMNNIARLD